MVLAWPAVWILGCLLFAYRSGGAVEGRGGRLCLRPGPDPDSGLELLLQWGLVGGLTALVWLDPALVAGTGFPLEAERIRIGVAVNAGAFVLLTGLVWLRGGAYPGFAAGARPFRFVSSIASRVARSQGLARIFSRRDPALKRIAAGGADPRR